MEDQKNRRLFIAFLTFLLGLSVGSGLVMFCSKGKAAAHSSAAASPRLPHVHLSEK